MTIRDKRAGIALILVGALMFGLLPTAAKFAYADGANALFVMLSRAVIGVLAMLTFMLAIKKSPMLDRQLFKRSWLAGISHALAVFGILASIVYIDISLASMILFLYPFPVAIAAHLRGETPLTTSIVLLMITALFGLALVLGVSFANLDLRGVAIATVGMFAFATMVLSMSRMTRESGALPTNLAMTIWATLIFAVIALTGSFTDLVPEIDLPLTAAGWFFVALVGLTFSAGYLCFFVGANIIGASRASLLSISEPVLMIMFAVAFLGETLSPLQWLGVAIVVASLSLSEVVRR